MTNPCIDERRCRDRLFYRSNARNRVSLRLYLAQVEPSDFTETTFSRGALLKTESEPGDVEPGFSIFPEISTRCPACGDSAFSSASKRYAVADVSVFVRPVAPVDVADASLSAGVALVSTNLMLESFGDLGSVPARPLVPTII